MKISVVIPTLNRKDILRTLLDHLRADEASLRAAEVEIVVVEDKCSDGTSAMVREEFPEFKLLHGPGINLRAARRFAIENTEGDYVVFLDDDALPRTGWIASARPALERSEAIVQSKLVFLDLGQEELRDESSQHFRTGFRWDMMPVAVLNGGYQPQYIHGLAECGCFLLRKLLSEVPFDDPNLHGDFGEAGSFFFRAQRAGYKIFFEPGSVVEHLGALAGGCLERDKKQRPKQNCNESAIGMVHNFMLFARMRNPLRIPLLIPYYVAGGAYLSLRQRKNCLKYFVKGVYLGLTRKLVPMVPYQMVGSAITSNLETT